MYCCLYRNSRPYFQGLFSFQSSWWLIVVPFDSHDYMSYLNQPYADSTKKTSVNWILLICAAKEVNKFQKLQLKLLTPLYKEKVAKSQNTCPPHLRKMVLFGMCVTRALRLVSEWLLHMCWEKQIVGRFARSQN